ncbi:MAG: MFS transporter [Tissierellia bacterium]|nr:MFS transporter [Tissierellia bacterium]
MKEKLYHGKIFYGWYIVAAAFVIMAVGWGITFNTASLFINPISEDLGLSRKAINMTFTIRSLCQLVISLFAGLIYTRLKMKNLMKLTSITLALSFFLHAYVKNLGLLYFLTITASVSMVLLGTLPLSIILNNWFHERIGFVIGLAFTGSGLGGMILNSLIGKWIIAYGWRVTYKILGIILFVAIVPCVFFIIKIHPKEIGLTPLGTGESAASSDSDDGGSEKEGMMLSEAMKTIRFWGLCLSLIFISISGLSLMQNISPHLIDVGYSIDFSANIVALSMGALAIGKMLLGYLLDKLGLRKTSFISSFAILFGCIAMLYPKYLLALAVVIAGAGIGTSYYTVANPVIAQRLYGRKDYNSIYGFISAAHSLGGIISPIIIGFLYDLSGSYFSSFKIMVIISVLTIIIFNFVLPREEAQKQ